MLAWQAEATALLRNPPPDPDAAQRLDLRHQHVVTIDDADTRGAPANLPSREADCARWVEYVRSCPVFFVVPMMLSLRKAFKPSAWRSVSASPLNYSLAHAVTIHHARFEKS